MSKSEKGIRRSAEDWAALISTWEASGLSAAAFARDKDFSTSSLYAWKKRLAVPVEPTTSDEHMSFVPLVVDTSPSVSADDTFGWRIETASGVVLSMNGPGAMAGFEAAIQWLGEQGAVL